jgi:1,4-dihydroxy-2-naphthoate octaprenyltransferase
MKRTLFALITMSRPSQLLVVTLVYALGIFIALGSNYPFDFSASILGYAALIPISASIHYANEYADYETDALTTRTPFSGGSGGLLKYDQPRQLALNAAWTTLILGSVITLWGHANNHLSIIAVLILAFGAFFGWMYSVRPLALAWRGWGELDNAVLGAVLLPVFGYAAIADEIRLSVVLAVIPFGMIAFVNLLATTWADREADADVGKFTLATRWPIRRLRIVYWLVTAGSFILVIFLNGWILPSIVVWSSFLSLPIAIWGAITYTRQRSPFPTVTAMVILLIAQLTAW